MTSKLPMTDRPLVNDPDLSAALERLLAPFSGAKLEKAQAAVRRVFHSAVEGTFSDILAAYQKAIEAATGGK